jgi:hypothetical protein
MPGHETGQHEEQDAQSNDAILCEGDRTRILPSGAWGSVPTNLAASPPTLPR